MRLLYVSDLFLTLAFILCLSVETKAAEVLKSASKSASEQTRYTLSFDEFKRLSMPTQIEYIKALQDFMVRGDFGKDPQLKTSLLSLFINKVFANSETGGSCIFAGYIQEMIRVYNRLSCQAPDIAQSKCGPKKVMCNPLLFGKGVCVSAPFHNATEKCQIGTAPLENIVKQITKNADSKSSFDNLTKDITNYCKKPFPFNAQNCNTLKVQMVVIYDQLSKIPMISTPAKTKPSTTTK